MNGDVRPEVVDQLVGLLNLDPQSLRSWKDVEEQPTQAEILAAVDLQAEVEQFQTEAMLIAFAMIMPYRRAGDPPGNLKAAYERMPDHERQVYTDRMAALGIRPY